jgi:superfamily II DNA/RNA helicase
LQTYKVITEIARLTDLRTAVLVGGDSLEAQFAELAACPDALVATPGRLLHHLREVPGFQLRQVEHVVLDEADRLFEMGLGSQVRWTVFVCQTQNCFDPSSVNGLPILHYLFPQKYDIQTVAGGCWHVCAR